MAPSAERNLIGLDLNASRVRAVGGPAGKPQGLPLDGERAELPMAVSLQNRHPEIGRPALQLCRQLPHLVCHDFLPQLGASQRWQAGRHQLDAAQAAGLVLGQLAPACGRAGGLVATVPTYLEEAQLTLLAALAKKARLPLLGSLPVPLALALAAAAEHPWTGLALVLDADAHALTLSIVAIEGNAVRLVDGDVWPGLGVRVWKERLLNAVADHFIRQTRRDLRDCAPVEQTVYEQLDDVLEVCQRGQTADLAVHTEQWFQHLHLRPEDLASYCAPLLRQAVDAVRALRAALPPESPGSVIFLSATAGRLPGLMAALEAEIEETLVQDVEEEEDFGEGLLEEGVAFAALVHVLGPDAAARAAHELAVRVLRGEQPAGHASVAPLPPRQPLDAGPARLHFRGQDHLLEGVCFLLGRQSDCDLVFTSEEYPTVSSYHCEIVYDRRHFHLRDRSRNGTLVNDRPVSQQAALQPGDWIRLGPGGPLLRFLGRAADQLKLMTTA